MPNREQLTEFAAPPFNSLSDVRGDPLNADLRILFAGTQYMVLPELMGAFDGEGPRSVFYETLPPGILIQQFRAGGIRIGSLELRFTPDVLAASPAALGDLHEEGLLGEPKTYASNDLALLVAEGNPHGIRGLSDLGVPGIRVALPDPQTEGVGGLALAALEAAGGRALREEVCEAKRDSGETVLTSIHHRQSPAWVSQDWVDAAIVWSTEATHLQRDGAHVEGVRIAPEHNQRGEYAAAVVNDAPHEEAAQEFLEFLTGATAAHIYAEFGFDVPR